MVSAAQRPFSVSSSREEEAVDENEIVPGRQLVQSVFQQKLPALQADHFNAGTRQIFEEGSTSPHLV